MCRVARSVRRRSRRRYKHGRPGDQAHKIHRQSAAGDALVARLKAAERSKRASGAKVDLGVTGQLNAEQDGAAITAIVTRLKTRGISQATLQQLAPSALTAAPYDLLAHVG